MCLAVPARVIALLDGDEAEIDIGGVSNRVSVALLDEVAAGDYVIVHVGFAIARMDVDEAERSIALFREMAAGDDSAGARHALPD